MAVKWPSNGRQMAAKWPSNGRQMAHLSVLHFTKYLLSYIDCHGYILYRYVPKLSDYVGNPLYSSTTKFGNPNLRARYFLNAPKIAENRKISNFKGTYYLKFKLLLHKYFDKSVLLILLLLC